MPRQQKGSPLEGSIRRKFTCKKSSSLSIVFELDRNRVWQATVYDEIFPGLVRDFPAKVKFEDGLSMDNIATGSSNVSSKSIHLIPKGKNAQSIIYVGFLGLRGGGRWMCPYKCGFGCPNNNSESDCGHKEEHMSKCPVLMSLQEKERRENEKSLERLKLVEQLKQLQRIKDSHLNQKNQIEKLEAEMKVDEKNLERKERLQELEYKKRKDEREEENKRILSDLKGKAESDIKSLTRQESNDEINLEVNFNQEVSHKENEETTFIQFAESEPKEDDLLVDSGTSSLTFPNSDLIEVESKEDSSSDAITEDTCQLSSLNENFEEDSSDSYYTTSDHFNSYSKQKSGLSMNDLTVLDNEEKPTQLQRSTSFKSLDQLIEFKPNQLITHRFTYYSQEMSAEEYISFIKGAGKKIYQDLLSCDHSTQEAYTSYLSDVGSVYPAVIHEEPPEQWLILSLARELLDGGNSFATKKFATQLLNLKNRYSTNEQQVKLLYSLLKYKRNEELSTLQLADTLEILSLTDDTSYDLVCSDKMGSLKQLRQKWILEKMNNIPQFASEEFREVFCHLNLSLSIIIRLLEELQVETDYSSSIQFLRLIVERNVPELTVMSIIYERQEEEEIQLSRPHHWLDFLLDELCLSHLKDLSTDVKAMIRIWNREYLKIRIAMENFIFHNKDNITRDPSKLVKLLELINDFQVKDEIISLVFNRLIHIKTPSNWIKIADAILVRELFSPGNELNEEEMIKEIAQSNQLLFSNTSTLDSSSTFHFIRERTIGNILKRGLIEDLKPLVEYQKQKLISTYQGKLNRSQESEDKIYGQIKSLKLELYDLINTFHEDELKIKEVIEKLEDEKRENKAQIEESKKASQKEFEESQFKVDELEKKLNYKTKVEASDGKKENKGSDVGTSKGVSVMLKEKVKDVMSKISSSRMNFLRRKEAFEEKEAKMKRKIEELEIELLRVRGMSEHFKSQISKLNEQKVGKFTAKKLYLEILDSFQIKMMQGDKYHVWLEEFQNSKSRNSFFDPQQFNELISGLLTAFYCAVPKESTEFSTSQLREFLSTLFPFDDQSDKSSFNDPLVTIFLSVICALRAGQVTLITDSSDRPIAESLIVRHLVLYEELGLVAQKKNSAISSVPGNINIFYGKQKDFATSPYRLTFADAQNLSVSNGANSTVQTNHQEQIKQVNQVIQLDSCNVESKLKEALNSIHQCYKSPSLFISNSSFTFKHLPISEWTESEVKSWSNHVHSHYKSGFLLELIAVVKRAVELCNRFSPRSTQLLALLTLLNANGKGRLAQVNTGEGKSVIVMMKAAIHALQRKKVDVITTSTELSKREVKAQQPFFEMLNLTVGENSLTSGVKTDVYKCNIVYGIPSDFMGDILRQEFKGENTRGERDYDVVIVDEVDSLLFDNRTHVVRLSSMSPGMNHLKLPLSFIWMRVNQLLEVEDRKEYIIKHVEEVMLKLLRRLNVDEAREYDEFLDKSSKIMDLETEIMELKGQKDTEEKEKSLDSLELEREKVEKELSGLAWKKRDPIFNIPEHLREYSIGQIKVWTEQCLVAVLIYKRDKHYCVKDNRIIPVQYKETGELQHNMIWGDGLTQFLQMKEGLPIEPEGITTNYISNIAFFKRYRNSIFGLTGTLGDSATRSFLEELYQVDFVVIPPFKRIEVQDNSQSLYSCKELKPILVDEAEWVSTILDQVLRQARHGRAALVICEFIDIVNNLAKQLRDRYIHSKVFTYTGTGEFKKLHEELKSGEIILATNIAGRGTDLKTSSEVEKNGGMYVVLTFQPETSRNELQNVGRTARAGKKGMAQKIYCKTRDINDIGELDLRRKSEERRNLEIALREAKKTLVLDALFQHFCDLENEYLPSASDCESMERGVELTKSWNKVLKEEFTEDIIEERFKELTHCYEKKSIFQIAYKEKLLIRFRDSYSVPDPIYACLKAGKPFVPVLSNLAKKYDWKKYERLAVEERWGIWLKSKRFRELEFDSDYATLLFDNFNKEFKEPIKKDADTDKLVKNLYYYTLKGNSYLKADEREKSMKVHARAIEMDPIFSIYSRYNKVRALLSTKENNSYISESYDELKKAKSHINLIFRPNLVSFQGFVGKAKLSVTSMQHDLDLLGQFENYLSNALQTLNNSKATGKGKSNNVEIVSESLQLTFRDANIVSSHQKAIREAVFSGLPELFNLGKIPPYPYLSIFSVATIGISQVGIGCYMTLFGAGTIGLTLIRSGISDVISAIKAAYKGTFDWCAWTIQKGIELCLEFACFGLRYVKGVKAIEATSKEALTAAVTGTEATAAVLSKEVTVAGIKKLPNQIVMETVSLELGQQGLTEIVSYGAQIALDVTLVKDC